MVDDLSKKGAQDRSCINIHEDYEVRYWSNKLGVLADELKSAVQKVGNSAQTVGEGTEEITRLLARRA